MHENIMTQFGAWNAGITKLGAYKQYLQPENSTYKHLYTVHKKVN